MLWQSYLASSGCDLTRSGATY